MAARSAEGFQGPSPAPGLTTASTQEGVCRPQPESHRARQTRLGLLVPEATTSPRLPVESVAGSALGPSATQILTESPSFNEKEHPGLVGMLQVNFKTPNPPAKNFKFVTTDAVP